MDNKIVILVGKSGVGKTHLENILQELSRFRAIISHTTRKIRKEETDSISYNFITDEYFMELLEKGMFLETDLGSLCAGASKYGITKMEMDYQLTHGNTVVVVSPDGAKQIRKVYPKAIVVLIESDFRLRMMKLLERETMTKQDIYDRLISEEDFEEKLKGIKNLYRVKNNYDEKSALENIRLIMKLINK